MLPRSTFLLVPIKSPDLAYAPIDIDLVCSMGRAVHVETDISPSGDAVQSHGWTAAPQPRHGFDHTPGARGARPREMRGGPQMGMQTAADMEHMHGRGRPTGPQYCAAVATAKGDS